MKLIDFLTPLMLRPAVPYPAAVSFRPAEMDDGPALHAGCYPQHDKKRFLADHYWRIRQQMAGTRLHLLAFHGAEVVGSGHLIRYPQRMEIADLMVAAEWRSQGVGSAIITIMTDVARKTGRECLEIGVLETNEKAHDLYVRLGFVECRRLQRPGREPAIVLCKHFEEAHV